MRSFNRFLLAGTSHLTILMMGAGVAWADWEAGVTNPSSPVAGPVTGPNAADGADGTAANGVDPAVNGENGHGSAGILVTNSNGYASLSSGNVTGGTAGNGGDGAGGGSSGGGGGDSVGIMVTGQNAEIIVRSGATASGGVAGTKGSGGSYDGGSYGVRVEGDNTSVTVESGASLTANGSGVSVASGLYLQAANVTVVNRGTITSTQNKNAEAGALGMGHLNSNANITNYGSIIGNGTSAVDNWSGTASLTNAAEGTIEGRTAIHVGENGSLTLVNNGTIKATGNSTAISTEHSTQENSITNNGTILGDVGFGVVSNSDHVLYLNKGSTLTGDVFTAQSGNGNVVIGNSGAGVVTLNGDIGEAGTPIRSLTVANGATLKFGQASKIYAGGISSVDGMAFDFGSNRVEYHYYGSVGYTETDSGTGYFKTTIDANAGKHGYFVIYAENGNAGSDIVVPTIVPTVVGTVTAGSKYVVMQDIPGRTASNTMSVVNSGGYRWTISEVAGTGQTDTDGVTMVNGSNNIVITATNQNAAGAASGSNGAGVRALATYSGSDAGLQALSQAVNNLTSDADIKKAGAQLRPETTGNTAQASMGAVTQALSTIQVRTDAVRVASGETGVSSGESLKGLGVWGQGFGSTASQGERNDVSGYDANTYGLAFGADFKVIEPLRVGLSFAYAQTGVDSTGDRSGSGQDINSYITSLYGTYSGKGWYVDGALTYGIHKYDAKRHVAIAGAAAQTLDADYSGQQYGAKAEVGVPLAVGPAVVTPLVSLAYNNLKQDSYSETGGSAALQVGSSTTDSIRSGLGAKASHKVASIGNWEITPNARAVWYHEFNKSSPDQTSTYVAGGSSFTSAGTDVATEHFNLGLGVDVASLRNTTISAKYDADLADQYVSHSASLQLRTEF